MVKKVFHKPKNSVNNIFFFWQIYDGSKFFDENVVIIFTDVNLYSLVITKEKIHE